MRSPDFLMPPDNCVLVLIDHQAGLAHSVESIERQRLFENTVALVQTARVFDLPIVVSTSVTKVYSDPLLPGLRDLLPTQRVYARCVMNVWEDQDVRGAIQATGRRNILFSGMLTEACISLPVLCAQADGYSTFVVADACGGLTAVGHEMALRRMQSHGAQMTSWAQVLLELQRDWSRHAICDSARSVLDQRRRERIECKCEGNP